MALFRHTPLTKMTLILGLLAWALVLPPALSAGAQKKLENTDPAQRLKWHEQHQAMKEASPFNSLKWRLIGPDIISGRCTDIAVPGSSKHTIYVGAATGGV